MTTQPINSDAPPAPEPAPLTVTPEPGSRLEQLQGAYATAKAESDAATKRLKAITDALKVELTSLDANERRFELAARDGVRPIRLTYVESWRINSTKLKAEAPDAYLRFAEKSGSWRLAAGS